MTENKIKELQMAKFALDNLVEKYPSMFEKGKRKSVYSYDELRTMRIRPTQVKADIKYVRRLLLEVEKEL